MSSEPVVELRPAKTDDAETIRDVVRSAYAKWIPIIGREPRPMNADYGRAVREHQIDVMYLGVGMVGLIETILRDDHLWIENVAVRPDAQGTGLGRRLLAHAEHKAAEAGLNEIRLLTNSAFETNIGLYQKVGYIIVGSEPFMDGATIYMSKQLKRVPLGGPAD